ncbi:hypothetical protein Ahy_B10g101398 [Arachis hypogaea]|uniref:Uncharacterized protein n=1 Tax=Arachis hypogaea TaxID=3818 RepID=A0A444WZI1_ARAHY|nr:hypothetical protein Ahy_B10g101398 [Arachis hypogaea]
MVPMSSQAVHNVERRINRPVRVDDRLSEDVINNVTSMFPLIGKAVGAATFFNLLPTERLQAHRYVLVNCTTVENFLEASTKRKLQSIGKRNEAHIDKVVRREFTELFKHEVNLLYASSISSLSLTRDGNLEEFPTDAIDTGEEAADL